jgi:hypothetical protein
MTLQVTIGPDGTVHLDIPSDLPPGPARVQVTIQPTPAAPPASSGPIPTGSESAKPPGAPAREAALEATGRFCSGLFLGRLPEDYDIDSALDEMNARWKATLEDLRVEP